MCHVSGVVRMQELAVVAGVMSTTLFVVSYLPMLHRAVRTRDLDSYSRPSLVLANVGNVIQAVYVYSLPLGPIWFLHAFYLAAKRPHARPASASLLRHPNHSHPTGVPMKPTRSASPPVRRPWRQLAEHL